MRAVRDPPATFASSRSSTSSSRAWPGEQLLVVLDVVRERRPQPPDCQDDDPHGRCDTRRRGRRAARAPLQHPHVARGHGRRLRELRERQPLRLRVHDHLRARGPRDRGGRGPRRRRLARERVAALHARADRRDGGQLLEVADDRGDQEPARVRRRRAAASGRYASPYPIRSSVVGWRAEQGLEQLRRVRVRDVLQRQPALERDERLRVVRSAAARTRRRAPRLRATRSCPAIWPANATTASASASAGTRSAPRAPGASRSAIRCTSEHPGRRDQREEEEPARDVVVLHVRRARARRPSAPRRA